MSPDLDLSGLRRVHDPDPAFVAGLRARLESAAADPSNSDSVAEIDVEPVDPLGPPRDRRVVWAAAAAVLVIAGIAAAASIRSTDDPVIDANDTLPTPTSPPTTVDPSLAVFVGGWHSVDGDGSALMMTIVAVASRTAEMTVRDDAASVCAGAPSTMTGTGEITNDGELVIGTPQLICDDGATPEELSGPPLEDQLRDLTFSPDHDDTLADSLGGTWRRAATAAAATERGEPSATPYAFFDGEVTASAAAPWQVNIWAVSALSPGSNTSDERVQFAMDPFPAATGCTQGPAAADAAALATAVLSDPDLDAADPTAATIAGVDGIQMDVTLAPDATTCADAGPGRGLVLTKPSQVISPFADALLLGPDDRMRLYLIDLPAESGGRVLAVAITAGQTRFDAVVDAAAPIIDSIELHTEGP